MSRTKTVAQGKNFLRQEQPSSRGSDKGEGLEEMPQLLFPLLPGQSVWSSSRQGTRGNPMGPCACSMMIWVPQDRDVKWGPDARDSHARPWPGAGAAVTVTSRGRWGGTEAPGQPARRPAPRLAHGAAACPFSIPERGSGRRAAGKGGDPVLAEAGGDPHPSPRSGAACAGLPQAPLSRPQGGGDPGTTPIPGHREADRHANRQVLEQTGAPDQRWRSDCGRRQLLHNLGGRGGL